MNRWLWLIIILIVAGGTWFWWEQGTTDLAVTGEATVKAAPDEYIFGPTYEAKDADKTMARDAATLLGNEILSKLKSLGVTDAQISTNVSVNQDYQTINMPVPVQPTASGYVGTYTVTATIPNLDLAKSVQEYIGTTPVTGLSTPTSTFKAATRTKLERDARKLALEDAKAQADDTASTLNVRIRGIKSIGQPSWGGPIIAPGMN